MDNHSISVWYACKPCHYMFHYQRIDEFLDHKKKVHFQDFQKAKCIVFEEKEVNEDQLKVLNLNSSSPDCMALVTEDEAQQFNEAPDPEVFCEIVSVSTLLDKNNPPVVDSKLFNSVVRIRRLTAQEVESSRKKGKRCEEPVKLPLKTEPLSENSDFDHLDDNYEPPPCTAEYDNSDSDFDVKPTAANKMNKKSSKASPSTQNENSSCKPFLCQKCGKSFRLKSYLRMHEKTHSDARPYKCPHPGCPQAFKTVQNLRSHKLFHSKPNCNPRQGNLDNLQTEAAIAVHRKKYKCELCSKEFLVARSLLCHQETHKNREDQSRPYVCEVCGAAFTIWNYLREHLAIHSDDRPYKCPYPNCTLAYKTKPILRVHKKTHAEGRTYKCHHLGCEKSFKTNSVLTAHLLTHNERLPCPFDDCSQTFSTPQNLRGHLVRKHREVVKRFECELCHKKFAERLGLKRHAQVHSEEKPFKCTHEGCSAAFNFKGRLAQHEVKHTGEKPYQCDSCGKAFWSNTHLQRHIKGHKNIKSKKTKKTVKTEISI